MTRFFRTAFAVSLASLILTLISVVATGVHMPFAVFSCLLFGLLLFLLPEAVSKLESKKTLFALLGAAAALLGFLPLLILRCPVFHFVSYGLSVSAAAIFLVSLRHNTTHNNFKARFVFITIVLVCLLTYFVVSATTMRRFANSVYSQPVLDPESLKLAMNDIIPIAIVLLSSGVLCLRGLRAQNGAVDSKSYQRRQLRDALIFTVSVSVIFLILPLLKPVWTLFAEKVLAPIGRLFASLLERIVSKAMESNALSQFNEAVASAKPTQAPSQAAPIATPSPSSGAIFENHTPPPAEIRQGTYLYTLIAFLIIAIVITLAAIILMKALRRFKKHERSYPNESREELPETDEPKKEKKLAKHSADPRRRMRYLYADFLKQLKKVVLQRTRAAKDPNAADVDPNAWSETSNSGHAWTRAGMSNLPTHTASNTYMLMRDEGLQYDNAATVMRWFDRRPKERKQNPKTLQVFKTSTCGEIEQRAQTLSRAAEADLAAFTAYYERARYRTNEEPSPEDAARMAELFRKIKPEL
jgi:large-conductance mechanosensitive channel